MVHVAHHDVIPLEMALIQLGDFLGCPILSMQQYKNIRNAC